MFMEHQTERPKYPDHFWSDLTYRNVLERMCTQAQLQITVENPCADGRLEDFRLSLVGDELTKANVHLNLRRHPKNPWSFEKLCANGWCHSREPVVQCGSPVPGVVCSSCAMVELGEHWEDFKARTNAGLTVAAYQRKLAGEQRNPDPVFARARAWAAAHTPRG